MIPQRYLSWKQVEWYCLEISRHMAMENWCPDLIVGITRGGALPAVLLSQYWGAKMIGLDVSLRDGGEYGPESNCWAAEDAAEGKRTLIVDDINDTGATFNWILKDWDWGGKIAWNDTVRFATLVDNESSKFDRVNYSGITINKADHDEWIVFPWEDWWKGPQ